MKLHTLFFVLITGVAFAVTAQDNPFTADVDTPEGVEVLTRGPIHEAFATPVSSDPAPGIVIRKAPPEPVEEVPPEVRPAGNDVLWIPGYWAWDDERDDFIWISGVWRRSPPNQRWVAGYWGKLDDGYHWISGFWSPDKQEEVNYYTPPPESLEEGPTAKAPADDYFWTPGIWVYRESGYRWRPGYWAQYQPNWVWVPDRWMWTPTGCIFVAGHWDYQAVDRGQLFMPVYINSTTYQQPRFVFRPWCAVNMGNLFVHFWRRPNYGHYYYGNYYGPRYANSGFNPWHSSYNRPRQWDPLLAYNQVHYRQRGINYADRVGTWNQYYADHADHRPPVTWRDQMQLIQQHKITGDQFTNFNRSAQNNVADFDYKNNLANIVGLPVKQLPQLAQRSDAPGKFTSLNEAQREAFAQKGEQWRKSHNLRAEEEGRAREEHKKLIADTFQKGDRPKPDGKPATDAPDSPRKGQQITGLKLPKSTNVVVAQPDSKQPDRNNLDPTRRPDKNPKGDADDDKTPKPPKSGLPEPKVDPKPEPRLPPKTDLPKTEAPDKPKNDPKDDPRPKPNQPPELPKGEPRPGLPKVEPMPQPGPKDKPDVPKGGPRIDPKTEPKVEPKPTPRPEPKADPRPMPKQVEPKPIPRPEPKPVPRPEPKADPRPMPKQVEPKPVPRPEPKAEPRPMPKQVEPKPVPRPEPKAEPRPEPKAEPRPMPKPKVEPKREPPRVVDPPRPKPTPQIKPPPPAKPEAKGPTKPMGDNKNPPPKGKDKKD